MRGVKDRKSPPPPHGGNARTVPHKFCRAKSLFYRVPFRKGSGYIFKQVALEHLLWPVPWW